MLSAIFARLFRPKPTAPDLRAGEYRCPFKRWDAFRGTAWENLLLDSLMEDFRETDPEERQVYLLANDARHNSDTPEERESFMDWVADIFRDWRIADAAEQRVSAWEFNNRRECPDNIRETILAEETEYYDLEHLRDASRA